MNKFYRYGRWWYDDKREAYDERKPNEDIYYDKGMKAYYILKAKKSIWSF